MPPSKTIRPRDYELINLEDPSTQAASSGCGYVAKKVASFVLGFLGVVLFVVTLPITIIPSTVSYFYNRDLKNDIANERLTSLKEGLNVKLSGSTGLIQKLQSKPFGEWRTVELRSICNKQYAPHEPDRRTRSNAVADFIEQVYDIEEMILNEDDPDDIREKINEAMSSDVYQKLKTNENNPAVELLQVLAVKDLSTKGEAALQKYGQKVLGPLEQKTFTWGELADTLDEPAGAYCAYQRNSWYSTLFWALAHPLEVIHDRQAEWFPMEYNGHKGNPNLRGPNFSLDGKTMQFYYGPGPTGDRLYSDGVLVYMDKLNRKGLKTHELRENYQNMEKSSESQRIYEMMRYEKQHPDSMRLLSMSFDTEAMRMPNEFRQFRTPQQFMLLYAKYALAQKGLEDPSSSIDRIVPWAHDKVLKKHKKDNGIFVGQKVIDKEDFKRAFLCASNAFGTLAKGNEHWKSLIKSVEGKQRLGKMMQLGTKAIISVGAVAKSLHDISSPQEALDKKLDADLAASRLSGACKQDVDRAVVENITLRLFFRLLHDESPLSQEEVYSIAGAVIGRARLVEGRLLQWKRYEVLSDLLHFVGNQENALTLAARLRAYVS